MISQFDCNIANNACDHWELVASLGGKVIKWMNFVILNQPYQNVYFLRTRAFPNGWSYMTSLTYH